MENLLIWLFLKDVIHFLPKAFQEYKQDFDRVKYIFNKNSNIFQIFYPIYLLDLYGYNVETTKNTLLFEFCKW